MSATPASFPELMGFWRVHWDGTTELFAALDPNGFPNAMAFDDDRHLYLTDSFLAQIYKISPSGETRVWIADPLLAPAGVIGVGANGIEFDGDFAYVAHTDQGTIVRIRATDNPPRPEVFVSDPELVGADGIAFDLHRNLYAVIDIQNTLVRVSPGGYDACHRQGRVGLPRQRQLRPAQPGPLSSLLDPRWNQFFHARHTEARCRGARSAVAGWGRLARNSGAGFVPDECLKSKHGPAITQRNFRLCNFSASRYGIRILGE